MVADYLFFLCAMKPPSSNCCRVEITIEARCEMKWLPPHALSPLTARRDRSLTTGDPEEFSIRLLSDTFCFLSLCPWTWLLWKWSGDHPKRKRLGPFRIMDTPPILTCDWTGQSFRRKNTLASTGNWVIINPRKANSIPCCGRWKLLWDLWWFMFCS